MGKHKYYSGAKGEFVQNKMKEGRTNKQARQDWKRSDEKKEYTERSESHTEADFDPIDRGFNSLMQD
jgi:hypothetical protein